MAEMVLERDETLEQIRLRHERYNALVGVNHEEERREKVFGSQTVAPQRTQVNSNYVADRVRNASDVTKGVYTVSRQSYLDPAPQWDYLNSLQPVEENEYEEEETEDSRPTTTTTQYMSVPQAKMVATTEMAEEYFTLSASARIVIAVLATFVLAVIALIWVNASVIGSLSAETAALEQQIVSLNAQFASVQNDIATATSAETIQAFAEGIGMILG